MALPETQMLAFEDHFKRKTIGQFSMYGNKKFGFSKEA
jgi:hypothetical protein